MEPINRKLRSSGPLPDAKVNKPKVDVSLLPIFTYPGKTKYYSTSIDCALICDELLKRANDSMENFVLGFDMEWPFSFQNGPGKTSLIQISSSLDMCYLFQTSEIKKLPLALTELLSHTNVRITGVNIRNDIHKLARDFPGINSKLMLENCVDVRPMAKSLIKSSGSWSMEKLIIHFFERRINKDKSVRMSKWNQVPLNSAQIKYAATDAYGL